MTPESPPLPHAEAVAKDRTGWLAVWCLRATLLWGVVTVVLPLLMVTAASLATRETYGAIRWDLTWANYEDIWHPLYGRIFLQSMLMAGAATVCCLVLGFPVAYLIARAAPLWQRLGLMLIVIPLWTNFLIRTYAWMVLLRTEGVLNGVLSALGVIGEPLPLLYTPGSVLVGLVYGYLPFMVLPIYAALERVPVTLEEAARDLYACAWAGLYHVVWPLVRPGVIAGSVLVFLAAVGAYLTPDLLGGAKTMMVGNLIQHEFLVARDWPLGAALAMGLMGGALALVSLGRLLDRPVEWESEG